MSLLLLQVAMLRSPWHCDRVLQSVPGSSGVVLWRGHLHLPERTHLHLPVLLTPTQTYTTLLPAPCPGPYLQSSHHRECYQCLWVDSKWFFLNYYFSSQFKFYYFFEMYYFCSNFTADQTFSFSVFLQSVCLLWKREIRLRLLWSLTPVYR